jgi:hypothetical protein
MASQTRGRPQPLIGDDEMLQLAKAPIDKHWTRWRAVFEARCALLKRKPKGSWNDAYRVASKQLANTPARGTPRTMKSSYAKIQRTRHRAVKIWF